MHTNVIHIKDLIFRPVIGVYEKERNGTQEIRVDLTIHHTRTSLEDTLETTLDYDAIVERLETYAKEHKPYLIETFAHAVATECLKESSVVEVAVVVTKPQALQNGIVSVTIQKSKDGK